MTRASLPNHRRKGLPNRVSPSNFRANTLPVQTARHELLLEFYEVGDAAPGRFEYMQEHGLSWDTIDAHAGTLIFRHVQFLPDRRFDFADPGPVAAVIEVLAEDGVTSVDLVAWPIDDPKLFATALGNARALGLWQARNPATYYGGWPLRIWRTPLAWLRNGCRGAVVLEPGSASCRLAAAPGLIAAEDLTHGRELARLLHPYFDPARILVPLTEVA